MPSTCVESIKGVIGTPTARTVVDIDLGPDRQVSRLHAIISYDADSMQWYIVVNGRNGLRVDNNLLKRGTKSYLRNGSVIEIAVTRDSPRFVRQPLSSRCKTMDALNVIPILMRYQHFAKCCVVHEWQKEASTFRSILKGRPGRVRPRTEHVLRARSGKFLSLPKFERIALVRIGQECVRSC